MSFALEFHDSEVRDVVADGDVVRVRFSAASVRDADGGRGWLASVRLEFSGATLHGDTRHAFGKVTQGHLSHDDRDVALPAVPATWAGDLELALRMANGTEFAVRGHALVASLAGGAGFTPDLSC